MPNGISLGDVEGLIEASTFRNAVDRYNTEKYLKLYDYQELALASIISTYMKMARPVMARLPTGFGKSLVAYNTAVILHRLTGKQIVLMNQTQYNMIESYRRYGIEALSDEYPACKVNDKPIWHCTFSEYAASFKGFDPKSKIAVIDEIDQLDEHLLTLKPTGKDDEYTCYSLYK